MRVLVAGGTGVIGRPLVARLAAAGHEALSLGRKGVQGSRSTERPSVVAEGSRSERPSVVAEGSRSERPSVVAEGSRSERPSVVGAVVADALDAASVEAAVLATKPDVVMHQLTAIGRTRPRHMDEDYALTNRLRTEGTKNLIAACKKAGVTRFVAQSVCFLCPPGEGAASEAEAIWAEGSPAPALGGALVALERQVAEAGFAQALVCRYGMFWGPGTVWGEGGEMRNAVAARKVPIVGGGGGRWSLVHVEDAAAATVHLWAAGVSGVVHVCEDATPSADEVLRAAAKKLGAKPPWRVPRWIGRLGAGRFGVHLFTALRPASNALAKRHGWAPTHDFGRDFA